LPQVVDSRGQDFNEEVQRVYWAIAIGRMLFSKHDTFEYGTPGESDYVKAELKDIVTCFSMCCGLAKTGQLANLTPARYLGNACIAVYVLSSSSHSFLSAAVAL